MPRYTERTDREREAENAVAEHADALRAVLDDAVDDLRDSHIDGLAEMDPDAVRALVAWALSLWARQELGRAVLDAKQRLTWNQVADQVNRGVGTLHKLASEATPEGPTTS